MTLDYIMLIFLTLRAARRPRLFTLNAFDSGHDTSSGWSALSSNAALKQSSDWGPPGAQGRGSGAPGGPRGPFGAPGAFFAAVSRSGSSFFGQKPVQSKKLRCAPSVCPGTLWEPIWTKKLDDPVFGYI